VLDELFVRELLLFATIFAVGLGPALMLRSGEPTLTSRVALAPGFGLALLSGVLMTVNFFVPLRHAWFFVVVPMTAVGLWLAFRAARADGVALGFRGLGARGVAALAAIGLFAAGVGNYVPHHNLTIAPVGFGIYDAPGYITFIEGFESRTNDTPTAAVPKDWPAAKYDDEAWNASWDLAQRYGWGYKFQHTSSDAVVAAVTGLGGWAPWTMLSPFLVVLLATGALGAFGLAGVVGARGWPQLLAGLLYPGPLVYTAMNDGSQGLLAGLAVLPVLVAATMLAFEHRTKRSAVLAGLTFGGLQAVYPELLAAAVAGMGLALLGLVFGAWRRRDRVPITRERVRPIVGLLLLAGVAGLLVSVRTLPWTWSYVAGGDYKGLAKSVIQYNMGLRFLPGWLFQTREFYTFAFARPSGIAQWVVGVLLPLTFIAVCVYAFVRLPRARLVIGLVVFACAQAFATASSLDCSYCAQRTLFSLSPIIPAVLAGGLYALLRAPGRGRDLGVALGTLAVVAVGVTGWSAMQRMKDGVVSMPSQRLENLAEHIKDDTSGGIALEGFDAVPLASWLELPVTYNVVKQANPQRLSIVADHIDYGGFSYYGTRPADSPVYTPDYKWVLTRIGGFDHGRQEIYRQGPISLQKRAEPFDVIVARGVAVDQQYLDSAGVPWVQNFPQPQLGYQQGPLTLQVAASDEGTAYVRFELRGEGLSVKRQPGMVRTRPAPGVLDVCMPAPGPAPSRRLVFDVSPQTPPLSPPTRTVRPHENAQSPAKTIQLFRVGATTEPCKKAR
jgi:MFS family permease